MKQKFLSAALTIFTLFIISCTHAGKENVISGKWSFETLDGNYAELWIDNNSLLTVRNPSKRPFVFDYHQSGDTIILYQYGQRNEAQFEVDRFVIRGQSAEELEIRQDTVNNNLTRITAEVANIENTEDYKKSVLTEFEKRIK